jgi:acetyl-CoA carboxylase biotin carboxyl carrier protein
LQAGQAQLCDDIAGNDRYSGGTLLTRISIDPDTIRALAAVLAETGLTEIEIADKDGRIRVVRGCNAATATVMPAAPPTSVSAIAASFQPDMTMHPGAVVSPMVGVAYLAPEPGSPPFVIVGQQVTSGQTLLLIEAMKTFNQIKAPKSGTIAAILVQSGVPVEYGEALIILE